MAGSSILARMAVIIDGQTASFNKAMAQSQGTLKSFEGALGKTNTLLTSFGVGFGVFQVKEFLSDVIDVTAQFEKFAAVLANTLGSQSAAQAALDSIRVFAQETPFEVSEVTAAYVRWANQGLNPTIDKMGKLGDVASSLGAGFEQTAEAFKDLLVGQTKRIEEIGISATQANGKIQLSFKGVNLEIEKTVEGVEQALNTFSALQGVQGTSAQVAETLGGRISNLKDAYSNLLLTIGEGNAGALKQGTNFLIDITNAASGLVATLNDSNNEFGKFLDFLIDFQLAPSKFLLSLADNTDEVNKKLEENNRKLKAIQSTADAAFASGNIEAYIKALDQNIFKEEIIEEIRRRQAEEIAKVNAARATEIVSLDSLKLKLDELNKQFEETDSKDKKTLSNIGNQILATNAQIDALERLRKKQEEVSKGSLSVFGQKQLEDATLGSQRTREEELRRTEKATPPVIFDLDQTLSDSMVERFKERLAESAAAVEKITGSIREDFISLGEPIASAVSGIAEAIGSAVTGVGDFGQDILKVVTGFAKQLGEILIATGVAMLAAKALITNPYTAIIAGIALVALASAATVAISKSHSSAFGGGAGGRGVTNAPRLDVQSGQSISFDAKFRLEGKDLVAAVNSTNNAGGRLGG